MWRIEPVPSRCVQEALRFLVGAEAAPSIGLGAGPSTWLGAGPAAKSQVASLTALLRAPAGADLWWAWDGRPAAAALVSHHAGRTGFLFHSPLGAPGVDRTALAQVVRSATEAALSAGLRFVQVSMLRDGLPERAAAEEWGYRFVAELFYMTLELASVRVLPAPPGQSTERGTDLSWRAYGRFTEAELGDLILATYEGSQDCPVLLPLRPAADVLTTHKAGGALGAGSWWILDVDGRPAGCVLVNDRPLESAAEVEYLGLLPACRGRGLARRLIERAAAGAASRGMERLLLACDSRNARALRAYARAGFRRTHSRWMFAAIRA